MGAVYGVEGDSCRRGPRPHMPAPALRIAAVRRCIGAPAARKHWAINTAVAFLWRHESDSAVPMLKVVPAHKVADPSARLLQRRERALGIIRAIFHRAKQGLREGIVVADTWATERARNTQRTQRGQHARQIRTQTLPLPRAL